VTDPAIAATARRELATARSHFRRTARANRLAIWPPPAGVDARFYVDPIVAADRAAANARTAAAFRNITAALTAIRRFQ
jgi:hypothetical protein